MLKQQNDYSDMNICLLLYGPVVSNQRSAAMGMLFVFTGLGLVLFIGAVAALIWSIRSGQLDDLETPAQRMLTDEASPRGVPEAGEPASGPTVARTTDARQDAGNQPPTGSGSP